MPILDDECRLYMDAFRELTTSRPVHMGGMGYIPAQEVAAWGAIHGVRDLVTLWRHVHALDTAYVADAAEKAKRESEQQDKQGVNDGRPTGNPNYRS